MSDRYRLFATACIPVFFLNVGLAQAAPRLDRSFGLNGRVAVELGNKNSGYSVVVQPDNKIVVAGSSSDGFGLNFSLVRFNKDGSLDTTFNAEGSVITSLAKRDDEALALGLLSDGRIIAAGYSHNGSDRDFALACYLQDGSLDRTFGDKGVVLTTIGSSNEEITAIAINREDRITVAGSTEGTAGRVLVVARFKANGDPDLSFGEQGVSLIGVGGDATAEGILERENGTLVVSGSYQEDQVASLMLVGLDQHGQLDTAFGDKGVAVPTGSFVASEGYGLAEDRSGLLYLAAAVGNAGQRDTALFRFSGEGKADVTFGSQGALVTKVSAEDDVLYDVMVGESGVVASGFTTDAGTRQFLMASFPQTAATGKQASAQSGANTSTGAAAVDPAPIQEVRVNGKTRVQIRKMQVVSSYADFTAASSQPSRPASGLATAGAAPGEIRQDRAGSDAVGGVSSALDHIENFLLPSAHAAGSVKAAAEEPVPAQMVTTSFSTGESVSYAAAFDGSGNIVAVGTADGAEASSIVVARYAAEVVDDSILDQPGHRSSHIATKMPTEVTRNTVVVSGEIIESLGQTVVERGMVYSIDARPVYGGSLDSGTRKASATGGNPGENLGRGEGVTEQGAAFVQEGSSDYRNQDSIAGPVRSRPAMIDRLKGFLVAEAVAGTATSSPALNRSKGDVSPAAFVEKGKTASGAGFGPFSVLLDNLRPATVYYVRTYAKTARGEIFYGNQLSFRTADACFVATASFGTLLHPGVKILRQFRDAFLAGNGFGRHLVDLYYTISPPVADYVARYPLLSAGVRVVLLPFIGFSWLALHAGMAAALLCFSGTAAFFGWCCSRLRLRQ